ncbi:hypothetical protein QQS21_006795 [Conoideocrella luteorostrata]|uniref:Uncharacterized protein n=1 Tax=Conoideocrella luteorostrata TaxID=1105319 RepID=A0AAJ0FZY0_9HYPO|nr:hypothetical protein QQS21_006795 [Conoideocrella luteorostrata]
MFTDKVACVILTFFAFAFGSTLHNNPLELREIPQEHSHDIFVSVTQEALLRNNPKNIQDAVFGLVGIQSAAKGAGDVTDLDCLQQEIADQAFTNGKAIKDLRLMAGALIYRALEVNTVKVGLASFVCAETATNPEVQAISQHQDPASPNASQINKSVTLELAKQLKGIGADPELALLSGTFAPGDVCHREVHDLERGEANWEQLNDLTAKGNSCNHDDMRLGCIFRPGKLILDVSRSQVASAVANIPQTFTGTGGIQATSLFDFNALDTSNGLPGDDTSKSPVAHRSESLSTAAIVGIAAGSPIVLGILIIIGFAWKRRRKDRSATSEKKIQIVNVYEMSSNMGTFELDAVNTLPAELPGTVITNLQSQEHRVVRPEMSIGKYQNSRGRIASPNSWRPLSYVNGSDDHLILGRQSKGNPQWI